MFRGRLHSTFAVRASKQGTYRQLMAPPAWSAPSAEGHIQPHAYSMVKTPERKDSSSRLGGTLADNRSPYFDAKRSKMASRKSDISDKFCALTSVSLMVY